MMNKIILSLSTVLAALCVSQVCAQNLEPQSPAASVTVTPAKAYTKAFSIPENVQMYKVTFPNVYGIRIAGNLFVPKNLKGKAPGIVIGHPMGAAKEQAASVYGAKLASQGFVTLALDQIYWGESGGIPRHGVNPDMYAETYNAGVDFLGTRDNVDKNRIGALGICGSGSFVISAAKIDPRMKAVATVSMYNIGEMRRSGIDHRVSLEQRKKTIADAAQERYNYFLGMPQVFVGGSPFKVDAKSPPSRQHSYAFYHGRGEYVPPGEPFEINTRSDKVTNAKFMSFYPFQDIETISPRPMLFIMGENAHSRYFSEDAYKRAAEPKELMVIPGAGHFDLYDKEEFLPIEKLTEFFRTNLK